MTTPINLTSACYSTLTAALLILSTLGFFTITAGLLIHELQRRIDDA